jgi:hypothetical protein
MYNNKKVFIYLIKTLKNDQKLLDDLRILELINYNQIKQLKRIIIDN